MIPTDMKLIISRHPREETNFHTELELIFVVNGSAGITVDRKTHVLEREDILLLNSSVTHSMESSSDSIVLRIYYPCQLISSLLGTTNYLFQCDSANDRTRLYGELRKVLREAVYWFTQQKRKTNCLKHSILYRTLDSLIENYMVPCHNENTDSLGDDDKIQHIIQYINQNYQYGISLTEVAEHLYLSPSTLSRFFKKHTGIYFADYLSHVRMNSASRDLLHTDKSITQVAVDCGFSSAPAFNRSFKMFYGETPTEYRGHRRAAEDERIKEEILRTEELRMELRSHLSEQSFPISGRLSTHIDVQHARPLNKCWSSTLNAGSFDSLTQAQPQRQLLMLKDRLGFQYARIWSIFSPNMTLTSGKIGDHQNYSRVDIVLDFLLENGITPFIDLANRPLLARASLDVTVFWHPDYIPFESQEAWETCLKELLSHLLKRYGRESMKGWRFELSYNRPNMPESNYYKGPFDYFKAFRAARNLIKEMLPEAEVGGPMGNISGDEDFMQDFLECCRKENCMPDFVSFMLFPYYTVQKDGQWHNELAGSEQVELEYVSAMRDLLNRTGCSECKLYITEWNNTVSSRNYLNDSAFRGAYMVRKLPELSEHVDLICPWLATDLISSYYDVTGPVNGSPGLLTRDSIPKPALYALQFMNALGGNLVERRPNYILTSKESGSFYLLCTNFKWFSCNYFLKQDQLDRPNDVENIFEDDDLVEISLTLTHVPEDCFYLVKERRIYPQEGAVLGEWKKFQYEGSLSPSNIRYIREACVPKKTVSQKKAVAGCLPLELVLQPHEIRLIHIQPENRHQK